MYLAKSVNFAVYRTYSVTLVTCCYWLSIIMYFILPIRLASLASAEPQQPIWSLLIPMGTKGKRHTPACAGWGMWINPVSQTGPFILLLVTYELTLFAGSSKVTEFLLSKGLTVDVDYGHGHHSTRLLSVRRLFLDHHTNVYSCVVFHFNFFSRI